MSIFDAIIQIIASFFGTLGFGFLFNIRGKKILWAAFGGMLSWALFLALGFLFESEPLRYFIVAICSTAYAEALAKVHAVVPACLKPCRFARVAPVFVV